MISVNKGAHAVQSVKVSCKETLLGVLVTAMIPGLAGLMMLTATFCRRRQKGPRLETSVQIKISVIKI